MNDKASELLSETILKYLEHTERDVETIAKLTTAIGNMMRSPSK